jgi:UDP-GlcNAc:undecaprenyl-phosphate/decaprenyl-phosphate GlcNAc-1-phosphate transferase
VIAALAAAAVGFVVALAGSTAGRRLLAHPVLARVNYRGVSVPTAGGVFAVIAVVVVEAVRAVIAAFGPGTVSEAERFAVLAACVGFAFLGLVDDLFGSDADRGFRGHVRALATGKVTTGMVKVVGGAALAVVVVAAVRPSSSGARLLVDAALVALAANLANLFDRAPGRTIKVALLAWVPIALIARGDPGGVATATVVGAFAGLLGADLREQLMLGDTGANALGGAVGLAVVLEASPEVRTIVAAVLVALTVVAEFVSFTAMIERVAPLRFVDRLGRRDPGANTGV